MEKSFIFLGGLVIDGGARSLWVVGEVLVSDESQEELEGWSVFVGLGAGAWASSC